MPTINQLPLLTEASSGDQLPVYTPVNGDTRRLPLNTTTPDGTEVLITSTQIITTLTIGPNGAANVFGAPATLAANGFARLRYVAATNSWYRIG